MKTQRYSLASRLVSGIALCACWLLILAGCGQSLPVTRPPNSAPKTAEVNTFPEEITKE